MSRVSTISATDHIVHRPKEEIPLNPVDAFHVIPRDVHEEFDLDQSGLVAVGCCDGVDSGKVHDGVFCM